MLRNWIIQEKIHAIHLRDLERNLENLGILNNVIDGSIRCFNCNSHVELEEIQCLFMDDDEIRLCCYRADCFEKVLEIKER
jgi:hypothetical protein